MQLLQSMFDLTSSTQANDGISQIDHSTGAYISYPFHFYAHSVTGSLTSPSSWCARMKETRPMAYCYHLMTWPSELGKGLNHSWHDLTSVLKTLVYWLEFELRASHTADKQSSNWADWAVNAALLSQLNFNKIAAVRTNILNIWVLTMTVMTIV